MRSKGRNSVTPIYLFPLNIEPHHRSRVTSYITVQTAFNRDVKHYETNKVCARIVTDLNKVIGGGVDLPFSQNYPTRVVQYQTDNLEKHYLMCIGKSFSTTTFFSSHNYVSQEDREFAESVEDLLPHNFTTRDEIAYQKDVEALNVGEESHNLTDDSILNMILHFHVAKVGMMPPCIDHDLMAGKPVL